MSVVSITLSFFTNMSMKVSNFVLCSIVNLMFAFKWFRRTWNCLRLSSSNIQLMHQSSRFLNQFSLTYRPISFPTFVVVSCYIMFSTSPSTNVAYDGAIFVPIPVPFIWRNVLSMNVNLLFCKIIFIPLMMNSWEKRLVVLGRYFVNKLKIPVYTF